MRTEKREREEVPRGPLGFGGGGAGGDASGTGHRRERRMKEAAAHTAMEPAAPPRGQGAAAPRQGDRGLGAATLTAPAP